jgi:hypothetical protein
MEALSEKGGFHDHNCSGRIVRWGRARALVQRPRPWSGDSRCGIDRWFGEHRRRGGGIVLDGRDVCCGDLPSDGLSWGKCRPLHPRAARQPGQRKPAVDIDFASTAGMVTGRSLYVGVTLATPGSDLTSLRRLTVAQTRNQLSKQCYDGEERWRRGPIDVLLDYF